MYVQEYIQKNISNKIHELITSTSHLPIIPRYFIIDAILARQFKVDLISAEARWNQEIESVKIIHKKTRLKRFGNRALECAYFGLHVLKHLLFQESEKLVCQYKANARNFIISLMFTNQCLCASYSFYVQAMSQIFGYELLNICNIPGHAFSVIYRKEHIVLSFDAGFEDNQHIQVNIYPQTIELDGKQLIDLLDLRQTGFRIYIDTIEPPCFKSFDIPNEQFTLVSEIISKRTYKKRMERMFILNEILQKDEIKQFMNLAIINSLIGKYTFDTDIKSREQIMDLKRYKTQLLETLNLYTGWGPVLYESGLTNIYTRIWIAFKHLFSQEVLQLEKNINIEENHLWLIDLFHKFIILTKDIKGLTWSFDDLNKTSLWSDTNPNHLRITIFATKDFNTTMNIGEHSTIYLDTKKFKSIHGFKMGHLNHNVHNYFIAYWTGIQSLISYE